MSRPPLGSSFSLFGFDIAWYSLLMMASVALGVWLAAREEKRLQLPSDTVLDFALVAVPFGIVGARLYYVAFTFHRFSKDWLELFRIWNGGLAFYGAVLGGLLAAMLVSRRAKLPLTALMDAAAPSLAIAQAIGRWGNYANMEAYGARIYGEAAQFFPLAVEIRLVGAGGTEFWYWHMATFFYEFVWLCIVFVVLMRIRRRLSMSGDSAWWYLLLYGAGRTVIEGLRDDSLTLNISAAQVRVSQVLSAVLCVIVLVLFFTRLLHSGRRMRVSDYLGWAIALLGLACTFVGEFERNAYQALFTFAQWLLAGLLALTVLMFGVYVMRARRFDAMAAGMLGLIALSGLTIALGIGRLGAENTAYVALRQSTAMAHLLLVGAWYYLRSAPGRRTVCAT